MTTKYLTGAYPGGYTVANNVSFLDIESTASIGGTGIVGPTAATSSIQITNNGTVRATIGYGYGIDIFQTGANIVNGQSNYSALIEGSKIGISGSNTTVTNFGMIEGLGASYAYAGVVLGINSAVTNGSAADTGALIEGSEGISGRWSTVRNFGSIVGKNDTAVYFGGGNGSNSVMVANGSQADRVAHIQGAYNGVFLRYTIGTVTNYGIISAGGGEGVALLYGGLINNFGMITATGASGTGVELRGKVSVFNGSAQDTTASIAGVAVGITSSGNLPATIVNYGTVLGTGSSGYGIVLATGGRIRNGSLQDSAALIQGGMGGVSLQSNRATIVNFGTIVGGALGGGVMMSGANDILINGAPTHTMALIGGGGASVVSGTADTITNYGTISGLSLTSTTDVLKVEAGSVFETPVQDAGALSLVNGVGALSNLTGDAVVVSGSMAAATFSGFGTLGIGKAARFTLAGSGAIAAGQTLSDSGVLTVTGALVVSGAITGGGVIGLAAHATAEFDTAAPKALTVSLQGGGSVLELKDPSAFAATIAGFNRHGTIDLLGITATSAVLGAGDKLAIMNGAQAVATLQLAGSFAGDAFATSSDGAGGTFITVSRTAAPPHVLIAAAAALGADLGGAHAPPVVHPSYGRFTLAAPRAQIA